MYRVNGAPTSKQSVVTPTVPCNISPLCIVAVVWTPRLTCKRVDSPASMGDDLGTNWEVEPIVDSHGKLGQGHVDWLPALRAGPGVETPRCVSVFQWCVQDDTRTWKIMEQTNLRTALPRNRRRRRRREERRRSRRNKTNRKLTRRAQGLGHLHRHRHRHKPARNARNLNDLTRSRSATRESGGRGEHGGEEETL